MNDGSEQILYDGRPSWAFFDIPYVVGAAIAIWLLSVENYAGVLVAVACTALIVALLRYRQRFIVTKARVILRRGLIASYVTEIEISRIQALNVDQGILDRLLRIGTVTMRTAAEPSAPVVFKGIDHPEAVADLIRRSMG